MSCLTPNLGLIIEKWALKNGQLDQKRIRCVYLAILFQICTDVSSTKNTTYSKYFTLLDTTARYDLLRIREAQYGHSTSFISKSTTLQKRKKQNQKEQLCTCILLLYQHFFAITARPPRENACNFTFYSEDVNKRRRTFFLYEFAYIWQNKRLVIIVKKFEKNANRLFTKKRRFCRSRCLKSLQALCMTAITWSAFGKHENNSLLKNFILFLFLFY